MARIRTIKPEFWADEDLSELPSETHMLAAALLNYADDEGYFNANPKLVKAACCPLREDSVSIHESLTMLANIGYIELGKGDDGKQYGRIINFAKHQRINRPTESKIAKMPITWGGDTEHSHTPHGELTEGSPPEGKGKEQGTGNRESNGAGEQRTHDYPPEFEEAWSAYPSRAGGNPKRKAHQAWNARLKNGADPEDIAQGVQRYAAFVRLTGKENTEFVMQAVTFFGPDEHYLNDWKPPKPSGPPGRRPTETPRERAIRMAREQGIPYDPQ